MLKREYPADWDRRRRTVYQRDGYQCQNCGRRGGRGGNYELHCHHLVPKSKGGTHHPSNLITLCKACHDAVHKPHRLALTAKSATSSPPLLFGKLRVHLILLILTFGVGNLLYLTYCWLRRMAWGAKQ